MATKREKTEDVTKPAATVPKTRGTAKPTATPRTASSTPAAPAAKAVLPTKKKPAKAATIRQEDIAFRAYLLGEKRQQLGLPGDSLSDWVEAERQLLGTATHGVN